MRCVGRAEKCSQKPERKRPLGRPGCRWEDNIKMDLEKLGYRGVEWIHQTEDRDQFQALVNIVMNLWVPYR
jgi:hypothetical protein